MAQAVLELGTKFLLSYFIGSLMGALIVGRIRGGIDIRNLGSGNAGGTNALRTQGIVFAIAVVLIDVGKGAFSTAVIPGLDLPFVGIDPEVSRVWLVLACAAAAVMGHVWPIWHKFRGGKGAAMVASAKRSGRGSSSKPSRRSGGDHASGSPVPSPPPPSPQP